MKGISNLVSFVLLIFIGIVLATLFIPLGINLTKSAINSIGIGPKEIQEEVLLKLYKVTINPDKNIIKISFYNLNGTSCKCRVALVVKDQQDIDLYSTVADIIITNREDQNIVIKDSNFVEDINNDLPSSYDDFNSPLFLEIRGSYVKSNKIEIFRE
jgi:hypothetical protein